MRVIKNSLTLEHTRKFSLNT